ncbi:reticulon-1 isoform X3 [Helicoverpa armigera]|uniref:reticulon-1 isoform X3 n=1 Tax=Helicoverpa armigera TaxID=29058 RepID=UPI002111ADBD|nr:reticulon-1 isoform X3 [Helicoverpa armigera]
MDSADALLGGLASGDPAPATDAPPVEPAMKRDQDSTDDFEHLEREGKRESAESPHRQPAAAATRNFLDMERELLAEAPRAPSASADHIADKFTDSESDADTAGESPMHRADPRPEAGLAATLTPEPPHDPTPVLAPAAAPGPAPVPAPTAPVAPEKPLPEEPKPPATPEPAPEPPKPELPKPEPVKSEPAAPPKPVAQEAKRPVAHVIEAEVIFCQMGLDAWFDPQRLHPEVESLIYWRSAAHSGAALGAGLALLVALACCSVVSVLAYASLLALSAAVAFRIYKNVLQAVQKTNDGHPFKLFLVEDLVDSLKFGVLLWCLTYVGACFNGITLIILGWIALFTLPKAYEMNKAQVDANLELARAKINDISAKVRAAVPLGRKAESDKEK